MLRTSRWLTCDFPACSAVYDTAQYRAFLETRRGAKGIRDGAAADGWSHTVEGDDLCKRHTDVHLGRPEQPALFPVSEDDHRV